MKKSVWKSVCHGRNLEPTELSQLPSELRCILYHAEAVTSLSVLHSTGGPVWRSNFVVLVTTTTNNCTFAEMADMYFMYGLAVSNIWDTSRLYQEQFPGYRIKGISSAGFISISRDSGEFAVNQMGWRRLWTVSAPDLEKKVLCYMKEEPVTSMRRTAAMYTVSHHKAVQTLHEHLM
jgi:hypothetical protein